MIDGTKRQKVFFDISGKFYETYEETLQRFPDTLLGNKERRNFYMNREDGINCDYLL